MQLDHGLQGQYGTLWMLALHPLSPRKRTSMKRRLGLRLAQSGGSRPSE